MDGSSANKAQAEIRDTSRSVKRTAQHVQDSAQEVRKSAANIEDSAVSIESSADRTTRLAADRTVFAAERTYAAWVRTGLAALASGVGARALLSPLVLDPLVMFASTVLVLFSVFCFCAAVWRELVPRLDDPVPKAARIPRPILFLINGSLTLVALAALAGLWIGRYHGGL
jgi:putative membrane protein